MKHCWSLLAAAFILLTASAAHADLEDYLWELNAAAWGNAAAYQKEIQQHFDVSATQFGAIRTLVASPAEVALVLWLSERSGKPVEVVLKTRRTLSSADWGKVASELGLSPGSEDFAALKYGDLGWSPIAAARYGSLAEYTDFQARLN